MPFSFFCPDATNWVMSIACSMKFISLPRITSALSARPCPRHVGYISQRMASLVGFTIKNLNHRQITFAERKEVKKAVPRTRSTMHTPSGSIESTLRMVDFSFLAFWLNAFFISYLLFCIDGSVLAIYTTKESCDELGLDGWPFTVASLITTDHFAKSKFYGIFPTLFASPVSVRLYYRLLKAI